MTEQRPTGDDLDLRFLAQLLVDDRPDPEVTIDLTDSEPAVDIDLADRALRPPTDDSTLGRIVTPDLVRTARRMFTMMSRCRPLLSSPGRYHQTARRFCDDLAVRNLGPRIERNPGGPDDDTGNPVDLVALWDGARHRLEYFLNLADEEFDPCFRFNGHITGEYLVHVARCDELLRQRRQPASTPPSDRDRRRRKARALQHW